MLWTTSATDEAQPFLLDQSDTSSVSTLDTSNISSKSDTLDSPNVSKKLRRTKDLPSPGSIEIPEFSLDVELQLEKGDDIFRQTNMPLDLERDLKSKICATAPMPKRRWPWNRV